MGGFELGLGYAVSTDVRLEAFLQYRPSSSFKGRANFSQLPPNRKQNIAANLSSLTGMLAAYVDFPEVGLSWLGSLNPYIGAGVGVSRINIGEMRQDFPLTYTIVPGGQHTSAAWMVTAGVATPIADRLTLEFAWRYTDSGIVKTGIGRGRVDWQDGSRTIPLNLAATSSRLSSHGIQVSLRYSF